MMRTINVNVFIHDGGTELLTEISKKLDKILIKETIMAGELDQLAVDVQNNTDVEASAVIVLDQIKALLDAAGTDPVKLKALSDQLSTSRTGLAAAIARDTPPPAP